MSDQDLTRSLTKLSQLLDSAAPKVKIVILDSCRDNPLLNSGSKSLGGSKGLARLSLDDTSGGTLVAYATKPNQVAADGTGRNSPFTTALLAHMETPDLDVRFDTAASFAEYVCDAAVTACVEAVPCGAATAA